MPGMCLLAIEKLFVRKQHNVLVFLIVSAKSMEVPIQLSEDCYCDIRCTFQILGGVMVGGQGWG